MTVPDVDRVKLIRRYWRLVEASPDYFSILRKQQRFVIVIPDPIPLSPPALNGAILPPDIQTLEFKLQKRPLTRKWRIVCEGVVLEEGRD